MKNCKLVLLGTLGVLALYALTGRSQENSASPTGSTPSTTDVHIVITDAALREDEEFPPLQKEDIKVKIGKMTLDPKALIPAKGDQGALQLMILIDEILDSRIGNEIKELQDFIQNLPQGSQIGVAYMSNATISIAQNFTPDRDLAAKAIRLPRGTTSSADSPYLSLMGLVNG
jgi:hypothetical protein